MIPRAYILEWQTNAPWQTNSHIEQDLVIERSLVQLFESEIIRENLAFRGGTALHKLFLKPQNRYSEDIDLVQTMPGPIKPLMTEIRKTLSFLGQKRTTSQNQRMNTLYYRFDTEIPPIIRARLKLEINTREHFTVLGLQEFPFSVNSSWFKGSCQLTTYRPEELLGTKLRALYQRRKGRDLFDIYIALVQKPELDLDALLHCYREYMKFSTAKPPTQKEFLLNMEAKIHDSAFLGDTTGLLRQDVQYDPQAAYELVRQKLIENI
jgi:predicted nucleotidyltransferase component of viral defense system